MAGTPRRNGRLTAADADLDFCYVTTRGRVTGRSHRIEIWFAVDASTLYILSGGGDHSDWVRNVVAEPRCTVEVGDASYEGMASVVQPETKEDARARRLVFEKYSPRYSGDLTKWRERALPVALELWFSSPSR